MLDKRQRWLGTSFDITIGAGRAKTKRAGEAETLQAEGTLSAKTGEPRALCFCWRMKPEGEMGDRALGWHQLLVGSCAQRLGHSGSYGEGCPDACVKDRRRRERAFWQSAPQCPSRYQAYRLLRNSLDMPQKLVNKAVYFKFRPSALLQPLLLGAESHYIPKAYVPDDCSFSFQ